MFSPYNRQNEQIIQMAMKKIVSYESTDELTFDYLKVISTSKQNYDLLNRMIMEKRTHYKILKEMYENLFHTTLEVNALTFQKPESLSDGVSSILLRKSMLIKDYVQLMQHLPMTYASSVYPMIVDEQTHMTLLNYILVKNK